jgi:transposase
MDIIPRLGRPERRDLLQRGRKSGDPSTALRFLIVARLGLRKTSEALDGRIVLHFLPPYCPDANRIERVWQDLHANVTRNHRCKTMNALLGKARTYLEGYVWRCVTGAAPILRQAA